MTFYAQRVLTGAWLDRDVPITDPELTVELSGPGSMRGTITPERARLVADDGRPVFDPWDTLLFYEESGQIRWGGILVRSEFTGPDWELEAAGFATYPTGLPYVGVFRRRRVDPLDVVREIWRHVQAQPDGNLAVVVDGVTSDVKIGRPRTLLNRNLETGTDHLGTTHGFTSTGATLSSVTGRQHSGNRSLRCDMGDSHDPGTQIFETHFAPIDPQVPYSFYAWCSTGDTEPQQSFEVGVTALFFDQNHHRLGNYVYEETTSLPAGGEWTEVDFPDFTSAWAETAYVRLVVGSTEGDEDPMSVWVDGVMLVEGEGRGEDYELVWWESPDCGQEIDTLARETPFDYREEHTWADDSKDTVEHRLRLGYPRLGRRQHNLRFVEGENVADVVTVTRDGDEFANEIVGLGAGEGRETIRSRVPNRDGRLRRVRVLEDKSVRREGRMRALAGDALATFRDLRDITRCSVWNHPHAPLGSFHVGDDVFVEARTGWADEGLWCRILAVTWSPDTDVIDLELTRSDRYRYGSGVA